MGSQACIVWVHSLFNGRWNPTVVFEKMICELKKKKNHAMALSFILYAYIDHRHFQLIRSVITHCPRQIIVLL